MTSLMKKGLRLIQKPLAREQDISASLNLAFDYPISINNTVLPFH